MLSQKLKLIHHASIHPVHFGEFSFSSSYGQISRNHSFCRCGCLPWTWLGRILNFIGTWILNPLKTGGGQPMAFGGFGICLGGYFLCWILIIDPMNAEPCNTSGGQPVVFGPSGNPNLPKVINLRSSSKLALSHVPRVCASGRGNTSSRTPLIIFVCEFGASEKASCQKSAWSMLYTAWSKNCPNRDCVAFKKVNLQSCRYRPVFARQSRFGLEKLCFSDSYLAH